MTTNFDRIFEEIIEGKDISFAAAPRLPVPKLRWSGLVYLHGRLTETPTAHDLDTLVLSSGDFGLAYLTEGWAARFVSELLRNYVVCFVGYSINDAVLRYMMDALAADRLLGEAPVDVFAFGQFSKGMENEQCNEWRAKNVTPILYRARKNHYYLHRTLQVWSEHYRDGVLGNEQMISRYASSPPPVSTIQDDIVGRVLWALSDPTGLPAKRFAELDPVPPLDWLGPLSESRFGHHDLRRFEIQPKRVEDKSLRFSLLSRFVTYDANRCMNLVMDGAPLYVWDRIMHELARWVVRHIDSPRLFLWLCAHGGKLNADLARMISNALRSGDVAVSPVMRKLWPILLAGRVR